MDYQRLAIQVEFAKPQTGYWGTHPGETRDGGLFRIESVENTVVTGTGTYRKIRSGQWVKFGCYTLNHWIAFEAKATVLDTFKSAQRRLQRQLRNVNGAKVTIVQRKPLPKRPEGCSPGHWRMLCGNHSEDFVPLKVK